MNRLASRLLTVEAMMLLPIARLLVDHVAMKRWRESLGSIVAHDNIRALPSLHDEELRHALRLARHVERAALRLPLPTKCLPRAVALQWMLRRRKIASGLFIAVRSGPQRDDDNYHAWVEHDGEMLIGHCDRAQYRPLLAIMSAPASALPCGG